MRPDKGLISYQGFRHLFLPVLLVCFLGYTCIRTLTVDITWDEAASWLSFARFGFWKPNDAGFLDANNHILNTFFMGIWNQWLGSEVWMLRLHMLLFSGIYLFCAWLLILKIPKPSLQIPAFILLVAHPYLLDFLSLSRGYGISLALNMATWYLTYRYLEKPLLSTLSGILLLSALSVTAYFGQLNLTLSLWACLFLYRILLIRQKRTDFKDSARALSMLILFPLLFLAWLLPLLFKMQNAGSFYAGGSKGLLTDTLFSLAENMQYGKFSSSIVSITILIMVSFGLAYWIPKLRINKQESDAGRIFPPMMSLMLLLAIISLLVQHHLFGTPYPRDRMTVIYLPALMIGLAWIKGFPVLNWMLALLLMAHFLSTFNLQATHEWKSNAGNLKLFEQINQKKALPRGRTKVFIAADGDFFSVLNYYRISRKWNHLEQVFHEMERPNPGADYLIFNPDKPLNLDSLELIYTDPENGNTLVRNRTGFQIRPLAETKIHKNPYNPEQEIFEVTPETEFAGEINFPAQNQHSGSTNYLRIKLDVFPEEPMTRSTGLIVSFECSDGTCDYRYFNLYDLLDGRSGGWFPIETVYPVLPELQGETRIKIYLWNNNKQSFRFKNLEASYLEYKRI